jgi:hypothetical protein
MIDLPATVLEDATLVEGPVIGVDGGGDWALS